MKIDYKKITSQQTHLLRQKILRPHQNIKEMVYPLDEEVGSYHVGAFSGDIIIGVASVFPESQNGELHHGSWRIRGMAVEDDFRGAGIGKALVQNCLEYAKTQEAADIWCNARTSAIGFYYTFGFEQVGEEFEIEGIGPHFIAVLGLL